MEQQNSWKKSGVRASAPNDLFEGVEFPVAPEFDSVLPLASLEEVYRASAALLRTYLAIPGELERRRENGVSAEFVM